MSITESGRSARTDTEGRGSSADTFRQHEVRETKPSFMTTEFWAMLVGIAALIVVYLASEDASFDLWRAAALCTVLAVGYIVSRGLAKSASPDRRDDRLESERRRSY